MGSTVGTWNSQSEPQLSEPKPKVSMPNKRQHRTPTFPTLDPEVKGQVSLVTGRVTQLT